MISSSSQDGAAGAWPVRVAASVAPRAGSDWQAGQGAACICSGPLSPCARWTVAPGLSPPLPGLRGVRDGEAGGRGVGGDLAAEREAARPFSVPEGPAAGGLSFPFQGTSGAPCGMGSHGCGRTRWPLRGQIPPLSVLPGAGPLFQASVVQERLPRRACACLCAHACALPGLTAPSAPTWADHLPPPVSVSVCPLLSVRFFHSTGVSACSAACWAGQGGTGDQCRQTPPPHGADLWGWKSDK